MESGLLETTLHSVCDSNVTGGDRRHFCAVLHLTVMTGEVATPSCVLSNLHCTPLQDRHKAPGR